MPRGAKPKTYPSEQVESVRILYQSGMTQGEIAAELGLTQKIVWRLMQRHGIAARIAAKREQYGPANHMWKGKGANYNALHARMTRRYGQPTSCQLCGENDPRKSYDWASMTGDFSNPEDYRRLCRSCHWKVDKKIDNIRRG